MTIRARARPKRTAPAVELLQGAGVAEPCADDFTHVRKGAVSTSGFQEQWRWYDIFPSQKWNGSC